MSEKKPYRPSGLAQPSYNETVSAVQQEVDDTPVQVKSPPKGPIRRRARVTRTTAKQLMTRLAGVELPVGATVKVEITIPSSSLTDTWVTDPDSSADAAYSVIRREEQIRLNFEVDADPQW